MDEEGGVVVCIYAGVGRARVVANAAIGLDDGDNSDDNDSEDERGRFNPNPDVKDAAEVGGGDGDADEAGQVKMSAEGGYMRVLFGEAVGERGGKYNKRAVSSCIAPGPVPVREFSAV